jgi:hypothetical protein
MFRCSAAKHASDPPVRVDWGRFFFCRAILGRPLFGGTFLEGTLAGTHLPGELLLEFICWRMFCGVLLENFWKRKWWDEKF